MLLTEQEVDALRKSLPAVCKHQDVIRAAESAVLEKLKAQEPVCEVNKYHLKGGEHWCKEVLVYSGDNPYDRPENRTKLYTNPLPPDDVVRDAERYRWLRSANWFTTGIIHEAPYGRTAHDSWEHLDAAIDAAMKDMK